MPDNSPTNKLNDDPYTDILQQLLVDMSELRENVVNDANLRLQKYKTHFRSGVFTKSATNLAHYLALRHFDLRHLQIRLAQAGLSSLGRAEASVLSTLDSVIYLLRRAIDSRHISTEKIPSEYCFNRGQQLLEQHTLELFGQYYQDSKAHIMVTLATDAAWDYKQIKSLIRKGMTCVRINCAHDDATIWLAMIRNVRRAEIEMCRTCKIMMDLAGHKIRTGPIELGPPIHHIKTKKDVFGHVIVPGYIILYSEEDAYSTLSNDSLDYFRVPVSNELFKRLKPGVHLGFQDARGKQRYLVIEKMLNEQQACLASCAQGSYLVSECELAFFDKIPETDEQPLARYHLGKFSGQPLKIHVFKGDLLLLTTHTVAGQSAEYNEQGELIKPAQIGCTFEKALDKVKVGQSVWIDDGKLGAVIEKIEPDGILLRVNQAGIKGITIKSDKGINFPETQLELPALSQKDLIDLDFVCEHADLVGFSFVESLSDMTCLIQELAKRNATDLPIIAKIETNNAVKKLPEIILGTIGKHSLGIMIARGDLSVELGSARLAEIQEELLWLCEAAHIPVIWATQVLESIAKKGTRSRAEFTDAAMAVRAECVMLNKGPYIADAIEALVNVMIRMQEHQHKKFPRLRALHW